MWQRWKLWPMITDLRQQTYLVFITSMPLLPTVNHIHAQIPEAEYSTLIYLGQVFDYRQRYRTYLAAIQVVWQSSSIPWWMQVVCVGQPCVVGVVSIVCQNIYTWSLMDNCMVSVLIKKRIDNPCNSWYYNFAQNIHYDNAHLPKISNMIMYICPRYISTMIMHIRPIYLIIIHCSW